MMSDFLENLGVAVIILAFAFLLGGGCRVTINGKPYAIELGTSGQRFTTIKLGPRFAALAHARPSGSTFMNLRALALLLLLAAPASAQTLDVTGTTGRFFNIATGKWTFAAVPGVEMCVAKVTVSGSWWFDLKEGGYFEQDWSVAWALLEAKEQPKTWRDRLSINITGAVYVFRELGTDRVWMVETRYRVFGRN